MRSNVHIPGQLEARSTCVSGPLSAFASANSSPALMEGPGWDVIKPKDVIKTQRSEDDFCLKMNFRQLVFLSQSLTAVSLL